MIKWETKKAGETIRLFEDMSKMRCYVISWLINEIMKFFVQKRSSEPLPALILIKVSHQLGNS